MKRLIVFVVSAAAALAQEPAAMSAPEALKFFERTVQLIESTSFAIPDLARASAPVLESARRNLSDLRTARQTSGLTYAFLRNVRAYLALYDTVNKPAPFPAAARRQLAELREAAERIEAHFQELVDRTEQQLRNPDRDNLRRYAEANANLPPPQAGKPRVVFLGDSITDGWRLQEYFPDRDFVNRGISGQITGEMLGRMKADVINLKPAAMILLAGTNDLARGVALAAITNNISMIADLAASQKIKVILASILPVHDYNAADDPRFQRTTDRPPASILTLNKWIQDFAAAREYTYCNYHDAMTDNTGSLQAKLADDGLHPNSTGYRIMAPLVVAAIDKALGPPAKKRSR